jgi:epoxyqueuosine reductase
MRIWISDMQTRTGASAEAARLRDFLDREARAAGFDAIAVAKPDAIAQAPARLAEFLGKDFHGTMDWLASRRDWRSNPEALWPDAKSIVMLAMNYGPEHDPLAVLSRPGKAAISVYAQHRDYHDVIKGRLKEIAGRFAARTGSHVKVFVDTAPVMEKPLAQAAGIGWQGKHTNLVSREFGSWLFLGSIFTTAELETDQPDHDHCGSCRACLDVCPTDAFPAPYRLDARRCISYLTIEHKGPIPHEFREAMGSRIYGCDDCLAVCPWNKFARSASEARLVAREDLKEPSLHDLIRLDDAAFRAFFSGSPIKRIGRDRFIRNVLIAAGNSGRATLIPACERLARDASPLVRGAAVWALFRLMGPERFRKAAAHAEKAESDPEVRREWRRALPAAGEAVADHE